MAEKLYIVIGMTCDHCVASVGSEIGKVPGVAGVDVDLASGRVKVTGQAFTDDQVRDAVDEAGYALVDA